MQTIDSGFCRTSGAASQASATQGSTGFHGSFQDRADQLVRATVLSDLGQSGGHGRHSHGIQGVVAAIGKVLSGQDVTGTDAADDVLKKIETSLHKAAQKLADRGVDAKTIDATIDRFRAQLANALDGNSAAGSGSTNGSSTGATSGSGTSGSGTTSGSGAAPGGTGAPPKTPTPVPLTPSSVSKFVSREVRKERGAIDLVTAEGDRVSIRFRTRDVVTSSVKETTASDGTTTTAAKSSLLSRGGVKIEVDGDLNEDELKAIGDLLGKVDDIATQFFSGDVQAAFSAADSLGVDSDQIAGYRLNLTYSRKVSAAYAYAGASLPVSTQSPAAGGDASSASGAGSAGPTTDAASGSNGSPTAPASSPSGDSTSAATDGASNTSGPPASASDGASATPPATTPPASAQKTLIDFISDALSKLSSANGAGRLSFSTHWKMSVLVTAIQSAQPAQPTTAAEQATANNTQLFGDSLQKIASG